VAFLETSKTCFGCNLLRIFIWCRHLTGKVEGQNLKVWKKSQAIENSLVWFTGNPTEPSQTVLSVLLIKGSNLLHYFQLCPCSPTHEGPKISAHLGKVFFHVSTWMLSHGINSPHAYSTSTETIFNSLLTYQSNAGKLPLCNQFNYGPPPACPCHGCDRSPL